MTASTRIALRVSPGGSEARVVGRHGDAWKVRVTAAPEGGKANAAVIALLASALDLPERAVTLIAGHSARTKVFEVNGIGAAETERRLEVVSARVK